MVSGASARRGERRAALLARLRAAGESASPAGFPGGSDAGVLREAFSRLGGGDQEILRLVAWDGLSPAEAGAVLGCAPGAARARLHRARERLAHNLGFDPRLQRSRPCRQVQVQQMIPGDGG